MIMERKRKSVFSTSAKTYTKEARVKVDNPVLDNSVLDRDKIRSRFTVVSDLLSDTLGTYRHLQARDVEASPDTLKATFELEEALRRAKNHLSTASARNGHISTDSSAEAVSAQGILPVLPPIVDKVLKRAVFTHPGVSNDTEKTYDRLEILGDAYIELIATKLIWKRFQEIPSGRISQIRELLVKNETLAEYATGYGLDIKAAVPQDYLKQPKRWTKTRADIFEAYVAAAIISDPIDGYRVVENWLTQLWLPKLSELGNQKPILNAKETLARRIMGKGIKLRYIDERPPAQQSPGVQTFFVGVYLTGWGWDNKHLGSGQGPNKTIAGNEAAHQALSNERIVEEITCAKRAHEAKIYK
ncbi:ribonuclease III domain-containing protein [Aspergillus pseudotamarii]|uniref:Ribonuclease III domain-containing protein n=1 Tax=Aspergillus pseudotamarii TaxID=132259 RepID=A0A5N6SK08_ASPPS|nr:ribonuclease III domain-containing protein [Aspergillus pseudotamarii]KAE8134915.1 ribonuclease III domain-containing protein [Aspergillus pseudotamarii]